MPSRRQRALPKDKWSVHFTLTIIVPEGTPASECQAIQAQYERGEGDWKADAYSVQPAKNAAEWEDAKRRMALLYDVV